MLQEVAVELSDNPGELSRLLEKLKEKTVNILAFSIDQDVLHSTVRFIFNDPDEAFSILKKAKYDPVFERVLGIRTSHQPNSLWQVSNALWREEINIEYAYLTLIPKTDDAILILKVSAVRGPKKFQELFDGFGTIVDTIEDLLK